LKKLVALLVILAAFLSLNNVTFSQPQVTVHVTGGYNVPLPDLKGDYPADLTKDPVPYFMKNGFNAGADAKYYLGKKRNVGITLSLSYNGFSSGDITSTDSLFAGTGTNKINIFAAGLGVEYAFLLKGKANPFIGAEFTGNFFSGNSKFTPTSGTETSTDLKSASRFGVQFNGGVDIAFSKNIGGVVGVKYNLANLIGKDSATSTSTSEFNLNDKETSVTKARNISYIQLYAGLSFYFNRPKAKMKK
jgi:opacity protein-like surface antigen